MALYSHVCCCAIKQSFNQFNQYLLTYKDINGLTPIYLKDIFVPVSSISALSRIRSAAHGNFIVPSATKTLHIVDRALQWPNLRYGTQKSDLPSFTNWPCQFWIEPEFRAKLMQHVDLNWISNKLTALRLAGSEGPNFHILYGDLKNRLFEHTSKTYLAFYIRDNIIFCWNYIFHWLVHNLECCTRSYK